MLVDEAHRSHNNTLHANLLQALPNCARIGFTGTPILMGDKKRTHDIFGEFIDRYTLKESEADGATVPILYEGRTADGRWPTGAISISSSRIRGAVGTVGFWKSAAKQDELRDRLFMFLDENAIVDFERADAVADRLMELARANHDRLAMQP